MYSDDYTENVEISEEDLTEAQKIIIYGFMREGEFSFRDHLIEILQKEVDSYDPSDEDASGWVDGLRYCIHIVKEIGPLNA